MSEKQEWVPCPVPQKGNVLRWNEPLWAAPNKPRGKPDKIGEQQITAKLTAVGDVFELKVIEVKKLSGGNAPLKVKEGDNIRRKESTIRQGSCHRRSD